VLVNHYFARAGRFGRKDLVARGPELLPLAKKVVAVFGLGCVGAPSAFELARCGVGELRVLDYDVVDPGTIVRWPAGLTVAGVPKVEVVRQFVRRDYPYTKVTPFRHRLGAARLRAHDGESEQSVLQRMLDGASLIYDGTAERGVQHFLSDLARELGITYLGVSGTFGGWGGLVVRVRPGRTEGCWICSRHALEDGLEEHVIPAPPADPDGRATPLGCASPTFTGAGFDLAQVALYGARTAVSTLCGGEAGGYPETPWDVTSIAFRGAGGSLIPPAFWTGPLKKHPNCRRCRAS
jgi:molybdopterin/thiamine biosynthesis adenylyltransferase